MPVRPIKHALKEMMELFDEMKDVEEARNPSTSTLTRSVAADSRAVPVCARGASSRRTTDALARRAAQARREPHQEALRLLLKDNTILMDTAQLRGALDELTQLLRRTEGARLFRPRPTQPTRRPRRWTRITPACASVAQHRGSRVFARLHGHACKRRTRSCRGAARSTPSTTRMPPFSSTEPAPGTKVPERRCQRGRPSALAALLEDTALLHEVAARWGEEATPPAAEGAPMEDCTHYIVCP